MVCGERANSVYLLSSAVGDDLGIAMSFFFFGPRVVIENGRDITLFLLACSSFSHREEWKRKRERDLFFCARLLVGGNKKFGGDHGIVI